MTTTTSPHESAVATGTLIGYTQASASGWNLDRQIEALTDAGCARVFADKSASKDAGRPELRACLACLRPGDTLVVVSLERLSGSMQNLITTVAGLGRRGVGFRSLNEALDTTTPDRRLVLHVFAALAEFPRRVIAAGTREGLATARNRGARLGRPPAMGAEQIRQARDLLAGRKHTVSSAARLLGVSRSTIYKYVPEIVTARRPADSPPPPGNASYDQQLPARHADPPASTWARQQSRPGRPVLVAFSLADLQGPVTGTVKLPLRLYWSPPGRMFDMSDPDDLQSVYEIVLGEAMHPEELAYLNGTRLGETWHDLYLPKGVRRAWEEQHPMLRAATAPAA